MWTFSPDSLFTHWSDNRGKEQPEAFNITITFLCFYRHNVNDSPVQVSVCEFQGK